MYESYVIITNFKKLFIIATLLGRWSTTVSTLLIGHDDCFDSFDWSHAYLPIERVP